MLHEAKFDNYDTDSAHQNHYIKVFATHGRPTMQVNADHYKHVCKSHKAKVKGRTQVRMSHGNHIPALKQSSLKVLQYEV